MPGEKIRYSSWSEQTGGLRTLLGDARRVAMQYSPLCAIPYVSMVDAGTVELVRSLGVEVVSSAELIQHFEARWSAEALESHLEAGRRVDRVRAQAFEMIREITRGGGTVQEFAVAQFVRDGFAKAGLLCGRWADCGRERQCRESALRADRRDHCPDSQRRPGAAGYVGEAQPARRGVLRHHLDGLLRRPPQRRHARSVRRGERRARCGHRAREGCRRGGAGLRGFEVDDAARGYIASRGYGEFFVHRTGHSIGEEVHGNGANMDNLETHDERRVAPWTCFSIEPGVYLKDFGIRSEVNMFVGDSEARVTGEIQRELVII